MRPGHRASHEEEQPEAPRAPVGKPPTEDAAAAAAVSGLEPGARGAAASRLEPAGGGERFTLRADGMHMPHTHAAGSSRLDLSTPLEECGAIAVALLPVGAIDAATFRRYARLCAAQASRLQLVEITHGQARGVLRLCFVAAADLATSDWDALHAHRRVRAVVGLCDCRRETDLGGAYGRFEADLGRLELGAPRCRCLAFAPELGTDGAPLPSDDIDGMIVAQCVESKARFGWPARSRPAIARPVGRGWPKAGRPYTSCPRPPLALGWSSLLAEGLTSGAGQSWPKLWWALVST